MRRFRWRRYTPDPGEPDLRAYPAVALAAIVAVVYLMGTLAPIWTVVFAAALGLLLAAWIVAAVVDVVRVARDHRP